MVMQWEEYATKVAIQTFMKDLRLSYVAKCVLAYLLDNPKLDMEDVTQFVVESTDYKAYEIQEAMEVLRRYGYLDMIQVIAQQQYSMTEPESGSGAVH